MSEQHTDQPQKSLWNSLWGKVKWIIMAFAIWYLWRAGALSRESFTLSSQAWWVLPCAALCIVINTVGVAIRYHLLLGGLGIGTRWPKLVQIHLSGLFVQQIGSEAAYDAMRAFAANRFGGKGSAVVAAVMVDRILGVGGLTLVAIASLLLFWRHDDIMYIAIAALLTLAAIPVAFSLWHNLAKRNALPWLWKIPGTRFVASMGESVKVYRNHYPLLLLLLAMTMAGHVILFAGMYFCSITLENIRLLFTESVTAGALSSFATGLPLPLAGLGVGEAAFGEVVALMRQSGHAADYAGVLLVHRLAVLAVGVLSWLWLTLAKK